MDKQNIAKNLNDISLIEEQINSEIKEITTIDKNLETIYLNLLNGTEIILPKFNGAPNFFLFFDFFFNRINADKAYIENYVKTNEIMNVLIEELLNNLEKKNEKIYQEKLGQYFYDINFFSIFLDKLIKKQDIPLFKEKFLIVSNVSIYL